MTIRIGIDVGGTYSDTDDGTLMRLESARRHPILPGPTQSAGGHGRGRRPGVEERGSR
ncbi:hypothetical protein [Nonomuraea lactucae]|uniref:hypothetical protein n=1 Tax=Nonomuraea lactucae TaxID=2249762 RepID=UPI0013B3FF11|nr:hypothetical protein [Nonomuraea lactucae]